MTRLLAALLVFALAPAPLASATVPHYVDVRHTAPVWDNRVFCWAATGPGEISTADGCQKDRT